MFAAIVAFSTSANIEQKVVKLFDIDGGGLCIDDASGGTEDKRLMVGVGVRFWQQSTLLGLGVDAISSSI